MDFNDSGLPQDILLEKAFNYSYKNLMGKTPEILADFERQINEQGNMALQRLDAQRRMREKSEKPMPDSEYEMHKQQIKMQITAQLKTGPDRIQKHLEGIFKNHRVGQVKEAFDHAKDNSPKVLAAIFLVECVQSPVDYKNIVTIFGDEVADIVAEVCHLDSYPSERAKNVQTMKSETKTAFFSMLNASLVKAKQDISEAVKQGMQVSVPAGQEKQLFTDVKAVWAHDRDLSKRFVEVFNAFATVANQKFRAEVNNDGELELVENNTPPNIPPSKDTPKATPKKPNGKNKNGGLGGDVF